jgi:hypothetical protein
MHFYICAFPAALPARQFSGVLLHDFAPVPWHSACSEHPNYPPQYPVEAAKCHGTQLAGEFVTIRSSQNLVDTRHKTIFTIKSTAL